jgi:hypothetical protein
MECLKITCCRVSTSYSFICLKKEGVLAINKNKSRLTPKKQFLQDISYKAYKDKDTTF